MSYANRLNALRRQLSGLIGPESAIGVCTPASLAIAPGHVGPSEARVHGSKSITTWSTPGSGPRPMISEYS
jgi:hypothetical protein